MKKPREISFVYCYIFLPVTPKHHVAPTTTFLFIRWRGSVPFHQFRPPHVGGPLAAGRTVPVRAYAGVTHAAAFTLVSTPTVTIWSRSARNARAAIGKQVNRLVFSGLKYSRQNLNFGKNRNIPFVKNEKREEINKENVISYAISDNAISGSENERFRVALTGLAIL